MATDTRTRSTAFGSYVDSGEWLVVGTVAITWALYWVVYVATRGHGSGLAFAHLYRRAARNDDNQRSLLVGGAFVDSDEAGYEFDAREYEADEDDSGFSRAGSVARMFASDSSFPLDKFTAFLAECGAKVEEEYDARGGEPTGLCESEFCGEPYLKAGEVLGANGKAGYCSDDCALEGDEAAMLGT